MRKVNCKDMGAYYLLNNRYAVYKDCGVVYDTKPSRYGVIIDIPQYIFRYCIEVLGYE